LSYGKDERCVERFFDARLVGDRRWNVDSATAAREDWYLCGMAGESARAKAQQARERSERLARYAEQWEKGAEGESRTAAALARLGPEWTVWHDLKWPGRRFANIDHLAIGPAGIFVIDSKNWSGTITLKDNVLRQNGYRRETAVAGCADSALAVGELLPRYLDRVRPVLCFVRDEPVEGWARDVMLCSTTNVVAMLTGRPPVLGVDEIADAVITLQARMNSMPNQTPGRGYGTATHPRAGVQPQSLVRSTPAGPPTRTRNRRLKRSLKRLVTGIGVWWLATMALILTVGPLTNNSDNVLSPGIIVLAILSWLLMRRLIK
jgi:hypothetical protein